MTDDKKADETVPAPEQPAAPAGAPPPPEFLPPELGYRLTRRLGHGTFGEVYEGQAPGGVRIALKRISRSLDHPTTKSELEALEAIKNASHPFLLQTHAYWMFRDQLVIAMELAEGSLADRIDACKRQGQPGVPVEELLPYFLQAAEALDYLHSQNISHRDIKPQNLLYLKGYAKVADFGLARVHRHVQTTVLSHVGTPMYMAPEAWGKRISLQSDQYSLAATYFTARLGHGLFPSELIYELAFQHIQMEPDLTGLADAERRVLAKALAKKPEDRYPTCKAFAEALRDAVMPPPSSATVPALPPPPPPRWRWPAITAGVLSALLCGLIVGLIGYRLLAPRPVTQTAPAEGLWCPPPWEPAPGTELGKLDDGRRYYKELTREVGDERLTAVAVPPSLPDDPPLFYMLRDKVTNRVFRAVWTPAAGNEGSAVGRFRLTYGASADRLLPGEWTRGAFYADEKGKELKYLGIDKDQAGLPVVDVTMPEAGIVAAELGGQLPTYAQWVKATGAKDDDPKRESPAGPPPYSFGCGLPDALALKQKRGPCPVASPTRDVSVHHLHQLISNGYEWTRDTPDGRPVNVFDRQLTDPDVIVVGQSWQLDEVLTFARIANGEAKQSYKWDDKQTGIGFRVVLEPK